MNQNDLDMFNSTVARFDDLKEEALGLTRAAFLIGVACGFILGNIVSMLIVLALAK